MKKLTLKGNFFVILNEDDTEFSRHPLWDSRFQIYDEDTANPLFKFYGVESELNSKNDEEVAFRFDELLDASGTSFATIEALNEFLSENLAFSKGGGSGEGATQSVNGFQDDNATNAPQVLVIDTLTEIINNALGTNTMQVLPTGVTSIFDPITNRFDWSSLNIGSFVLLRLDFDLIPTSASTELVFSLDFGIGAVGAFNKILGRKSFKENKSYLGETVTLAFYIGSELTKNNPCKLNVKSDKGCSFKNNGHAAMINLWR